MSRTLALLLVLDCAACRGGKPSLADATPAPAASDAAPGDPLLEVASDKINLRLREFRNPGDDGWRSVAYDVAVATRGTLEVQVIDRADPKGPVTDAKIITSAQATLVPGAPAVLRFSFLVRDEGDAGPPSGQWRLELSNADLQTGVLGPEHLGARFSLGANALGGGADVISIRADAGFERLATWIFWPDHSNQDHVWDPDLRLLHEARWVTPEEFPQPVWSLRARFTTTP